MCESTKCYAVHEADGQDVTMMEEVGYALVTGGGKPGQGYPCVLVIYDQNGVVKKNELSDSNRSFNG